ncbi:MAG: AraC family ligand binding domain-containing protein, partial [Streptococcus parasanguinis]|nr:AraC family ligand binding domain-containing protein [Streptococcus parasanguinis]
MLVFSEYQTDTIDLALDFYGYEDCPKNYEFGPSVRDNFVLHYITKGKGVFHFNNKEIHLEAGDLFLLPKNKVTYYKADEEEPWSYYWIGISGTKVSDFMR